MQGLHVYAVALSDSLLPWLRGHLMKKSGWISKWIRLLHAIHSVSKEKVDIPVLWSWIRDCMISVWFYAMKMFLWEIIHSKGISVSCGGNSTFQRMRMFMCGIFLRKNKFQVKNSVSPRIVKRKNKVFLAWGYHVIDTQCLFFNFADRTLAETPTTAHEQKSSIEWGFIFMSFKTILCGSDWVFWLPCNTHEFPGHEEGFHICLKFESWTPKIQYFDDIKQVKMMTQLFKEYVVFVPKKDYRVLQNWTNGFSKLVNGIGIFENQNLRVQFFFQN